MMGALSKRRQRSGPPEINVAPMIDMMFILLVFFLVTASFVSETGIEVERPAAVHGSPMDANALRFSVTASGTIYNDGERIDLAAVRQTVVSFRAVSPRGPIVVIPDAACPSGTLVTVIDACKAGGAEAVAIATQKAP